MRREDFEHVIAAAANVTGEDEFVVIGSQIIPGRAGDNAALNGGRRLPAAPP
jgi:hypothetical protein